MSELQDQLEALRQRMARVLEDRSLPGFARERSGKFEKPEETAAKRPSVPPPAAERVFDPLAIRLQSPKVHVEEWLPGEEVETSFGKHYETETLYARHKRHGSADIASLAELPSGLLKALSNGTIENVPPQEWALDRKSTRLNSSH